MQTLIDKLHLIEREARRNNDIQDIINCEIDKLLKIIADINKMQSKLHECKDNR